MKKNACQCELVHGSGQAAQPTCLPGCAGAGVEGGEVCLVVDRGACECEICARQLASIKPSLPAGVVQGLGRPKICVICPAPPPPKHTTTTTPACSILAWATAR